MTYSPIKFVTSRTRRRGARPIRNYMPITATLAMLDKNRPAFEAEVAEIARQLREGPQPAPSMVDEHNAAQGSNHNPMGWGKS
jgi:hypothetical protein